jgi:hypothetical protein
LSQLNLHVVHLAMHLAQLIMHMVWFNSPYTHLVHLAMKLVQLIMHVVHLVMHLVQLIMHVVHLAMHLVQFVMHMVSAHHALGSVLFCMYFFLCDIQLTHLLLQLLTPQRSIWISVNTCMISHNVLEANQSCISLHENNNTSCRGIALMMQWKSAWDIGVPATVVPV